MPDFISIDASALEDFGQQIGATPEIIRVVSARLVTTVGNDTVEFARQQPGPATGLKQPFKTEKQRRFFFAAVRSGAIQVPYQRTGNLSRAWLVRLQDNGDTFVSEVFNRTPYRPYVQGFAGEQARIHRGRWSSQEQIQAAAEAATERRTAEAMNELERLFLSHLKGGG